MIMKREDYNKINEYFNELCINIFECQDLEDNYFEFIKLNDMFNEYFKNRYFVNKNFKNDVRQNNLTFQDVLDMARNIINTIDSKYLGKFDNLLNSGILDFSYESSYFDSHVLRIFYHNKIVRELICINREFNYSDVEILVHEFMHYVCCIGYTMRDEILSEFISIYFELYAIEYIYKNYNINIEELNYNKRIISCYKNSSTINYFELPLILYRTFGNLDEYSYKYSKAFISKYDKDTYEYECFKTLELIEKMQKDNNSKYYIKKLHYYNIATYLAYYTRKTNNIKNMLNFVNNINNEENYDLDLLDVLDKYNIGIKDDLLNNTFQGMDEYLDIFEKKARILN